MEKFATLVVMKMRDADAKSSESGKRSSTGSRGSFGGTNRNPDAQQKMSTEVIERDGKCRLSGEVRSKLAILSMTTFVVTQVASALHSIKMPSLVGIVLDYYLSSDIAMNYRINRLEFAVDAEAVQGTDSSSSVQARLTGVKALCATAGAFAAIVGEDNTVICWGNSAGDCSAVSNELKEVKGICASLDAFAALKKDGTVTTWGLEEFGGNSSLVQSRLKGVKAIYSTSAAFAAVLSDGTVEAWGDEGYGGLIPPLVQGRLKQVKSISGGYEMFAALLSDGTVETWGSIEAMGTQDSKPTMANELTQVVSICASDSAFAALRQDGTVVSWGDKDSGGDSSQVQGELKEVTLAVTVRQCGVSSRESSPSVPLLQLLQRGEVMVQWWPGEKAPKAWF